MIQFKNVSKNFARNKQEQVALSEINLDIDTGDFFGIVGISGSGKSTLLRLINGLERPSSGEVLVHHQPITQVSLKQLNKKIAMIFQDFNLLENLTVYANVALPLRLHGKKNENRIKEMLDFVKMSDYTDRYPSQLSGGQKQRVAIARALVMQPEILLCDEPTSSLDSYYGQEVMELLKQVQKEFQTTIIFVSHELHLIKQWCNRAAIIENGKIVAVTTVTANQQVKSTLTYEQYALEFLQ